MESFYTFTISRRPPRNNAPRGGKEAQDGAPRKRRPQKDGSKPAGGDRGKGRKDGKKGGKPPMSASPKPRHEKPMDPDSPFAILQKLKS